MRSHLVLGVGGPAPAIVAHPLEALGQDGLQEAAHELEDADGAGLLVAVILAAATGHTLLIPALHLAFVQGRTAEIGGQIL